MGWTIIHEDEDGRTVAVYDRDLIFDLSNDIDLSTTRLLKYLDPYGDLVLNSSMLEDFIHDLNQLSTFYKFHDIDSLIEFIRAASTRPHCYIRIAGD